MLEHIYTNEVFDFDKFEEYVKENKLAYQNKKPFSYDAILDYYIDDTNKSIEDIRKISDKFVSSNKKVDVVCFIIEFKG